MAATKSLTLHVAPMSPTKFGLNLTYGLGADVVSRFSRWLPRQPSLISDGTILAILNLCVAPMLPIKFRLNLTYGLGGDGV